MEEKYALISLSDKTNLEYLVKNLINNNYQIIATTSTAKTIKDFGFDCQLVEDITAFPEMLGGRVKTLQPQIHGGILADLSNDSHLEDLNKYGINPISLVVCNLYPFEQVLIDENKRHERIIEEEASTMEIVESAAQMTNNLIENIDIGGVTLIRAAAKNYKHVGILCNPNDYDEYVTRLRLNEVTIAYRKSLAMKGFIHTANYDSMIANFFMNSEYENSEQIDQLLISAPLKQKLRYGENPHQEAYYFESNHKSSYSLNTSKLLQGKELSYNNLLDIDAAYHAIFEFDMPCAIALKHNTPCGIGFATNIKQAYEACYKVDEVSIFGGIVIFNRGVDVDLAKKLNEIFLEIVIAPEYTSDALKEFSIKKNLRVIEGNFSKDSYFDYQLKSITGGFLSQRAHNDEIDFKVVTNKEVTNEMKNDLLNLFKAVKNVKSNAIVIGQEKAILGISGGMVSRVDAVEFALKKTLNNEVYDKSKPLLLASDGFFPFNDIVDYAIKHNIKYLIHPGGSLNDEKLIAACNENDINMIFTNIRFFRH